MDKSLEQQARQLKNAARNRERRRYGTEGEGGDPYRDERPKKRRSEPLKAAQEAYAAAVAASSMNVPELLRCELCQASFTSDAQMQQHLAGPVHKKAEQKAAQEEAKRQHLRLYGAVAEDALGAAAWQAGKDIASLRPGQQGCNRQLPQQQQQRSNGTANQKVSRQHQQQQLQQQRQQEVLSHEQVLAQARQADPLSLDGWVPPTIPSSKAATTAAQTSAAGASSSAAGAATVQQMEQQQHRTEQVGDDDQQPLQQPQQPNELGLLVGYGGSSSDDDSDDSEAGEGEAWHQQHSSEQQQQQQQVDPAGRSLSDGGNVAAAAAVAPSGASEDSDSSEDDSSEGGAEQKFVSFF